jgi:hypothetical protein
MRFGKHRTSPAVSESATKSARSLAATPARRNCKAKVVFPVPFQEIEATPRQAAGQKIIQPSDPGAYPRGDTGSIPTPPVVCCQRLRAAESSFTTSAAAKQGRRNTSAGADAEESRQAAARAQALSILSRTPPETNSTRATAVTDPQELPCSNFARKFGRQRLGTMKKRRGEFET